MPPLSRVAVVLATAALVTVACAQHATHPPLVFGPMRSDAIPAATDAPEDGEEPCTTDADCVMTNFTDCCTCCTCTKPPYAILHAKLHELEARCESTDCPNDGCNPSRCPPCTTPSSHAVCESGTCVER